MSGTILRGGVVVCDARQPGGGAVRDGAVLVRGTAIEAVGPFEQIREQASDAEVIGSDRHFVMPGLVNTHHHGWGLSTFQLGVQDDLLEPWLVDFYRGMRQLDPYLDTLWGDLRNIRSGVTTVLHAGFNRDIREYTNDIHEKLRAHTDSGIRAAYALNIRDQNTFVYQDDETFLATVPDDLARRLRNVLAQADPASAPDGVFALLRELVGQYEGHSRLSIMLCPIAPQWCSDDLLRRIRDEVTDLGIYMHLHCLESPYQREYGARVYGTGMVQHLEGLGFLDESVSLGHAVWVNDEEIKICAATGTSVCHNASSNLRLRVGILPAPRLMEQGVNLSLGMDGTGIDDDEDMLKELRLVSKLHRVTTELPPPPPPSSREVLQMGTANGARTLGLQDEIGSLAPGRRADIVLVDMATVKRPYLDPGTDPIDAILYRASGSDVDTVMIDGEVVFSGARFTKLDEDDVANRLAAVASAPPSDLHLEFSEALAELRPHVERFWSDWTGAPTQPYYLTNSAV